VFVDLEEKPYSDGGQRLTWRIVSNNGLRTFDDAIMVGEPGAEGQAYDTVQPRVNYALTIPAPNDPNNLTFDVPGRNEIFFQLSEYVSSVWTKQGPVASYKPANHSLAEDEFIATGGPFTVSQIAAGQTFSLSGNDGAQSVTDRFDATEPTLYPHPLFPETYSYNNYFDITTTGSRVEPPNSIKPSPRVSDVLISVPPQSMADSTQYFIWPVWAKYTNPPNDGVIGTGPWDTDNTGIIWDFTGRKALEERDATLQVRVNPLLLPLTPASIAYGFNVPVEYRNPPEHDTSVPGHSGLWLPPDSPSHTYIGFVPKYYELTAIKTAPDWSGSGTEEGLHNYKFTAEGEYKSVSRLDFFPGIGDSYVARLDIAQGAPIPDDWYRRVRPFSYDIHNLTHQRNEVTILNNVINPTTGEKTYLKYRTTGSGRVTVQVFTLDGNLVKVLRRESRSAGEWTEVWDGRNNGGRIVARGMYFIRVVGPGIDEIRKIMVVK
jgi:hypothetical protein